MEVTRIAVVSRWEVHEFLTKVEHKVRSFFYLMDILKLAATKPF